MAFTITGTPNISSSNTIQFVLSANGFELGDATPTFTITKTGTGALSSVTVTSNKVSLLFPNFTFSVNDESNIKFAATGGGSPFINTIVDSSSHGTIELADFGPISSTNSMTELTLLSIGISNSTTIIMTVSHVSIENGDASDRFSILVNGSISALSSVSVSITNVTINLMNAMSPGDTVTVAYTALSPGVTNQINKTSDAGIPLSSFTARTVINTLEEIKLFSSNIINSTTLSVTLDNDAIEQGNADNRFTVKINDVTATISSISFSTPIFTIVVTEEIKYTDVVTVSYTQSSSGTDRYVKTSDTGIQLTAFTDYIATNELPPPDSTLLFPSVPLYTKGTVATQIVNFSGSQNIHRVSVNLSVDASDKRDFIIGDNNIISFQASNFQNSRSSWVFQPVVHWAAENNWSTSGTTIRNTLQDENYIDVDDAVSNAPYLEYKLYFPSSGVYYLWGYGFSGDGIYWGFNDDITNIRKFTLGINQSGWYNTPRWTKFGSIFTEEGGVFNFTVYLGSNTPVILDQWYFTKETNFESNLNDFETPLQLSRTPFNTAVRLRSLAGGYLDDLENPQSGAAAITSWKSSKDISASGSFNYEIRERLDDTGVIFDDGLSVEVWQIGGDVHDSVSWDYIFID